jgi:hypothetical protein
MDMTTPQTLEWPYTTTLHGHHITSQNHYGRVLSSALGRVCKFGSALSTIEYEPRRFDQHTTGAAATTAPTPKTHDRATRP